MVINYELIEKLSRTTVFSYFQIEMLYDDLLNYACLEIIIDDTNNQVDVVFEGIIEYSLNIGIGSPLAIFRGLRQVMGFAEMYLFFNREL